MRRKDIRQSERRYQGEMAHNWINNQYNKYVSTVKEIEECITNKDLTEVVIIVKVTERCYYGTLKIIIKDKEFEYSHNLGNITLKTLTSICRDINSIVPSKEKAISYILREPTELKNNLIFNVITDVEFR